MKVWKSRLEAVGGKIDIGIDIDMRKRPQELVLVSYWTLERRYLGYSIL